MVVFFVTPLREWSSISYIASMTLLSQDCSWTVGVLLLPNNCKFCLTLWLSDLGWSGFRKTASCTVLPLRKLRSHVENKSLMRKLNIMIHCYKANQLQLVSVGGHKGTWRDFWKFLWSYVPKSFLTKQTVRVSDCPLGFFGKGKKMLVPSASKAE